jgi:hypothetical protein
MKLLEMPHTYKASLFDVIKEHNISFLEQELRRVPSSSP